MKKFLLGFMVAILGLCGAAYFYLRLGFLSTRADQRPSKFESTEAMEFLNASVGRRAPKGPNPFPASAENLKASLHVFETHCAVCHGDPADPRSAIGLGLYPPAPQFMESAPRMPENENFYIIQNGVRWTGMPSWGRVLSDDQIWKLTSFLAHIQHLPPVVAQEWKRPIPARIRAQAVKK